MKNISQFLLFGEMMPGIRDYTPIAQTNPIFFPKRTKFKGYMRTNKKRR